MSNPAFETHTPDFQTYVFDDGIPQEFSADQHGRLSICRFRSRHDGPNSLQWDWRQEGATLIYRHPQAFKDLTGRDEPKLPTWDIFNRISAISLWVYSEKPIGGELALTIGHEERVDVRMSMNLNFKGWRRLYAFYGRDMDGFPDQESVDTLKIIAPRGVLTSRLFFDAFCPRSEQDCRFVWPTLQTPWVNPGSRLLQSNRVIDLPTNSLTPAQRDELKCVSSRFFSRYQTAKNPIQTEKLRAAFDGWRITSTDKILRGPPIELSQITEFWTDAAEIATACAGMASRPERDELISRAIDMVDFWLDQGYADGPLPGQFLTGYALRTHFGLVLFHLKCELEQAGRFEPLVSSIRLMTGVEQFREPKPAANADMFHTELDARLFVILIGDDDERKWRELTMFQRWMESSVDFGELKPQGSFHHHEQEYVGYSFPAMLAIAIAVNHFSRTSFAMPKMHRRIREIAEAVPFYTVNGYVPHTFAGRWRQWKFEEYEMFSGLAEAGHPESPGSFDEEMAGWYLYFAEKSGKSAVNDPTFADFCSRGITAAPTPIGHLTMPYAVAALHRRGDWLVVFRGQRREFMGAEIYNYQLANSLGRYVVYGSLQVLHGQCQTPADCGFVLDRGWNWNFFPGTTTRELPFEALKCHFDVEEHFTDESFAAGVSLNGQGVFGIKLHEVAPTRVGPPMRWLGQAEYRERIFASMYDESLRARKSVFCFERCIIALGSGIENDDNRHPTITTLFQNALTEDSKDCFACSAGIRSGSFPCEYFHPTGSALWCLDSQRTGYYVAAGNDPVIIRRHDQQSVIAIKGPDDTIALSPTHGDIEIALIDHGRKPREKGYEYCLIPDSHVEEMAAFASRMETPATADYLVHRRDGAAHIVEDQVSRVTGMVIFEATTDINFGPILCVERPAVILLKKLSNGGYRVAVADPDLGPSVGGHYPDGFGPMFPLGTRLDLTLAGRWALASGCCNTSFLRHDVSDNGRLTSVLELSCRDGAGVQFEITPLS